MNKAYGGAVLGCLFLQRGAWPVPLLGLLLPVRLLTKRHAGGANTLDSAAVSAASGLAEANSIAQQALANVRTVYAFNGADRTVEAYAASLDTPMKVGALG